MRRQPTCAAAAILTVSVLLFSVTAGSEQGTATITGLVTVDEVPDIGMVPVDVDQAVCGDEVEDRATVVEHSGSVANAVIVVTGAPSVVEPAPPAINNKNCYFEPRVQVARTRSMVTVTSEDETLHTTHAYDCTAPSSLDTG